MITSNLRRTSLLLSMFLSFSAFAAEPQPEATANWYPSVYGENDEIGAANLLTQDVVLQAMKLVKQGKTLSLAVPIDKNFPAFRHRSFRLYNIQPGQQDGQSLGPNKFTFNDELVTAWTGIGTQLNGIGHIGINNVYYNGNKALMNPLMILVKIIKLRWIHILSYDQMVSRKINNQTTRC
ncbi:hypothetical protein AAF121_01775, partial [Acinetobacter baumannii]